MKTSLVAAKRTFPSLSRPASEHRKGRAARIRDFLTMMPQLKPNKMFKLIKLVKSRPYLWDHNNEKYNDKFLVRRGWRYIEEILLVPEDLLRNKWRNIRDTFRREFKKNPCKSPRDYKGKWVYFKPLFFLADSNIKSEKEITEQEDEESIESENKNIKIEAHEENEDYTDYEILEDQDEDEYGNEEREKTIDHSQSNDYDLMFLKSLVPYFTDLDPMRKLVLRGRLQDILLQELNSQARCNGQI